MGRMNILEKGDPKGAGTGCSHILNSEPVGRMTSLTEDRALAGTQEKKFATFESRGNLGGQQRCHEVMRYNNALLGPTLGSQEPRHCHRLGQSGWKGSSRKGPGGAG